MIALLVTVNDERRPLAGFSDKDGDFLLSACVKLAEGGMLRVPGIQYSAPPVRMRLEVEGLNYLERRDWGTIGLKVGDEITIKIVEADSADPPTAVTPHGCELPGFEHG